ncbi:MAG: OsmC family peroxiredoxin [Bacteroidetes bacterium]|nr:OsmC family peroxiredoxin [Bacteroidota bacterium]
MSRTHHYSNTIEWSGNAGSGTSDYRAYQRSHTIHIEGKPDILASADAPFRGDVTRHNPEDLFVASIATCHMLWYLHFCADAGIIVTAYSDNPLGTLTQDDTGAGKFTEVVLHPKVLIENMEQSELAAELHHKAHQFCFMANSVNFEVAIQPEILPSLG